MLSSATIHANIEQSIVAPFSDMPLSQDDFIHAITYDKEELCDDAAAISMSQVVNNHDTMALEPIVCAESKHFLPITSLHARRAEIVIFIEYFGLY